VIEIQLLSHIQSHLYLIKSLKFYLSVMKMLPAGILGAVFTLSQLIVVAQCEPFFGKLVINEVMAANNTSGADEAGDFDDWVEIYNGSDEAINMEGIFLSDNHGDRTKFVFPDIILEAGDVITVWCDDEVFEGELHAPFRLSANGEEVGLYNQDTTSLDYVRYGAIADDIAIGRFPNGHGPFRTLIPTFDGPNVNSVQPTLVINEYQAENATTASDQWGEYADWIELYNGSNQPINLEGYFLSDRIGEPTQYEFPDTIMPPESYLIIWCDQGLFEPGLHTFFKLGADGDDILLSNADTLTLDYVRFGQQIEDDTEGRFPNGIGPITCLAPTWSESNGGEMSVFNQEKPESFELWPNPASEFFWVNNDEEQRKELVVFNLQGKIVISEWINRGNHRISIEDFVPGLYILQMGTKTSKLIVK